MNTLLNQKLSNPEDAKLWAQLIAFAPVVFQVTRSLKNFKILDKISESKTGLTFAELQNSIDLSEYSLSVLLDGGESSGLLTLDNERYKLSLVGRLILKDRLTTVNMNFTHDVCYEGLFFLETSLRENKPAGLKVFGDWKTIYERLTELPPPVLKSWFEFDHFYSDDVFPKALPIIFSEKPKTILDVGGNTGKFAVAATKFDPAVLITILDHPKQLELAHERAREFHSQDRISSVAMDLLDHTQAFPSGRDAIWMSQFLDCFSKEDILQLMKRAHMAMTDTSFFYIMETFIDRQRHGIARFCLDMISFYFTCMANGNSRMYRATDFYKMLSEAGFEVLEEINNIGLSHTILKCRKK